MRRVVFFLVLTTALLAIGTRSALAGEAITFLLPGGVRIEIVEVPFKSASFTVLGCTAQSTACLINGHIPFGTDLELPKTYVSKITASYQGQTYLLDSSNMYNAWGGRDFETKSGVRYFGGKCFDAKNCQFRGVFSDAAGTFVAEWKVIDGISLRTVLTNSSDVVGLFLKHIVPPENE